MTPKELVQAAFQADIAPTLQGKGFSYVPSQFAFKRKQGDFTQIISITLSHKNSSDGIRFWSAFNVDSSRYNAWRKQNGMDKFQGHLGGCMDWSIPDWRSDGDHSTSFDFSTPHLRADVLRDWLSRCLRAGIPYLEKLSSWEGLGADLVRWRWHWGRATDYFVMADRPDRAVAALEAGIEFLEAQDFSTSKGADPILVSKKRRQAAERNREVSSYRHRIETITNSGQGGGLNALPRVSHI
mgnify:CR=1 FL=1|jgi:hypothetical protein